MSAADDAASGLRARIAKRNTEIISGLSQIAYDEAETPARRRKARNALSSLTSTVGHEQSIRSMIEVRTGGTIGSHRGDAAIAQQLDYDGYGSRT